MDLMRRKKVHLYFKNKIQIDFILILSIIKEILSKCNSLLNKKTKNF